MADRVGQQLGNYRLIRLLGQGGFAEVYLGQHIYLETSAAIKVLHTRLASEEVEHFREEARTVARLVHPHIVRVLEFNVEDSTPYLVVDYAPNSTLRKRHPRGVPLPLSTVVSYVSQIASALQYAHEQKVIHRDVKPENMLVGRRGEILLSDFGIALVAQSSRYNSTQGIQDMAGTIAYMAPEQIESQACPNSDQYSLAVVVYEWLSGARPFQGSFAEIAVKHTMVTPASIREKVPTLSQTAEEVVMKALAKDPRNRFATVQAFADALEQAYRKETASASTVISSTLIPEGNISSPAEAIALASAEMLSEDFATVQSLTSPSPPTTSLLNKSPQFSVETRESKLAETTALPSHARRHRISRRRVLLGLAGVAAVGALGGSVAWLAHVQSSQTTIHPPLKQSTLFTFTGHFDWVWSVAWSPLGERVASASSDGTAQVWDAPNGDHLNPYRNHTNTVYAVAWSPDGKRVASASYDKTVQVWDAIFGDHFYTYTGHTSWVWTAAWSPDGKRVASAGGDKTVQVWDVTGNGRPYVYRGHTDFVYAVAWSPDGGSIASAGRDGTIQVWNSANGNLLNTFTQPSPSTQNAPEYRSIWSVAWSPDGKSLALASNYKDVQVWNANDGTHLFDYAGHTGLVYHVAWSHDGRHIASASSDKTVQVWEATAGRHVYTYSGHTDSVRSVSWSPDNNRLASGSWDKTVRVWQIV
jgi:serine/threonine protein kinase